MHLSDLSLFKSEALEARLRVPSTDIPSSLIQKSFTPSWFSRSFSKPVIGGQPVTMLPGQVMQPKATKTQCTCKSSSGARHSCPVNWVGWAGF